MTEITRHFTATTFVVHRGKVLLHLHAKQGLWLPPGGHIDRDELPHHAAKREVEEETGLRVRLHSEAEALEQAARMDVGVVPQPAIILVEPINPYHQHVDFIYYAQLEREEPAVPGFQWFAPEELQAPNVPPNVREGAHDAVAYFAR